MLETAVPKRKIIAADVHDFEEICWLLTMKCDIAVHCSL